MIKLANCKINYNYKIQKQWKKIQMQDKVLPELNQPPSEKKYETSTKNFNFWKNFYNDNGSIYKCKWLHSQQRFL